MIRFFLMRDMKKDFLSCGNEVLYMMA